MHIGLIGGVGPAATEFYYRGLTDRHAKSGTRLELTIVNAEVRDLAQNLANKDCAKAGGDLCGFDIASQGGWRANCCRHLNGRSLLHRGASADFHCLF